MNYYTFSTRRSKDPPKPALAKVHPEHLFDLADAGVQGTGGSTLQEITLEMHLGVDSLTPKSHARNVRTSTITSGGGEMTYLDPDPVFDSGVLRNAGQTKGICSCAYSRNPDGRP